MNSTTAKDDQRMLDPETRKSLEELMESMLKPLTGCAALGLLIGALVGHPLAGMIIAPLAFAIGIGVYGFGYAHGLRDEAQKRSPGLSLPEANPTHTASALPAEPVLTSDELDRKAVEDEWNV